jgi:hypothetical protein
MLVFTKPDIDDADVVLGLGLLQGFCERAHRCLGRVIGLTARSWTAVTDRADVDDGAAPPLDHARQHRAAAVHHALEQHVDLVIEILDRPLGKITDVYETRVVDKTVGRPKLGLGRSNRRLQARVVGDIGLGEAMRVVGEFRDRLGVPRHQQQRVAVARERNRKRAADAVGRAGDDNQRCGHVPSPRITAADYRACAPASRRASPAASRVRGTAGAASSPA